MIDWGCKTKISHVTWLPHFRGGLLFEANIAYILCTKFEDTSFSHSKEMKKEQKHKIVVI